MRVKFSGLICLLMLTPLRTDAQVNFATYINLSQKIRTIHQQDGEAAVHTEKNRFTIYAVFHKGLVSALYAMDLKGNRIPGHIATVDRGCEVSFRSCADGKLLCYDIACNLLSKPLKPAKAAR